MPALRDVDAMLAALILGVHLAVIAFNVFGLVITPIGVWRCWSFVRGPAWRILHLACLAVVALQAALGQACFLTVWQDEATGTTDRTPLIMGFVDHLLFWRLPIWVFAAGYAAIFVYAVGLLWLAPLQWTARR